MKKFVVPVFAALLMLAACGEGQLLGPQKPASASAEAQQMTANAEKEIAVKKAEDKAAEAEKKAKDLEDEIAKLKADQSQNGAALAGGSAQQAAWKVKRGIAPDGRPFCTTYPPKAASASEKSAFHQAQCGDYTLSGHPGEAG